MIYKGREGGDDGIVGYGDGWVVWEGVWGGW